MVRSWSSTSAFHTSCPSSTSSTDTSSERRAACPAASSANPRVSTVTPSCSPDARRSAGSCGELWPTSPTVRVGSTPPPYISGTTMMATTIRMEMSVEIRNAVVRAR